jgi:hypothetical protein
MGEMRNEKNFYRNYSDILGVDDRIILKWVLKKGHVRKCTLSDRV